MMRHSIAVMALFCLLLGCTDFKKEGLTQNLSPSTNSEIQNTVKENRIEDFSKQILVNVQPSEQIEKYNINFSWPKYINNYKLRIKRDRTLSMINLTQTTFSEEVSHNQTLSYNFELLDQNLTVLSSFTKIVPIPRDFVVRPGQNEFYEPTKLKVNRFSLAETPLYTNGFDVQITTEQLISDKGLIETFANGSKAAANNDGRSGGELVINAKSASGFLTINMRGENGGDGTKGEDYAERAPGGNPATKVDQECECSGISCNEPKVTRLEPILINYQPALLQCYCKQYGQNGGSGLPGVKGRKGNPARKGGDSGNLKINFSIANDLSLITNKFIGIAGNPGPGGEGQLGGLGGAGREPNDRHDCRGTSGANGPQGPTGDSGDSNVNGNLGTICVFIENEGRNECF